MKWKITLLSLITFASTCYAKRNIVEWNSSKIKGFGDTKTNLLNFKNVSCFFNPNIVFIVSQQKIRKKQLKLSELVWERLSSKDVLGLDKGRLPDDDVTNISHITL